jgi:hypothetical protein
MSSPLRSRLFYVLPILVAVVAAASSSVATAPAQVRCADGYTYAGRLSATRAHGVRATLTALAKPEVSAGHVAAWVGVGGAGLGPRGTDQWLQVGLSAFHGTGSNLYYEVTAGGRAPRYHELDASVAPGERIRVAVLETANRRGWWRIWVNGKPRSKPIHLPGSSGRFHPIATAETWDGGTRVCNRFHYRFDGLGVAGARGGSWHRFVQAHRFQDRGYRVLAARTSFVARVA